MLATTTPQSPGRPAPPPSSSPGTSKSKSAMKPSTSSGSSASTTTTPGDSLPPLPVSPRQQRHSTAAVGSANANSSPRHGTRSGPHSRRASFSTATDSVPGSPSQPSSGMATGTGTATGTDAVQFLKDRTSQRKSSTSAPGSSTPLAAHGSQTSAPPSAGSNGRKHRPAALQLGNHSTFASSSSSSSSFDHPAPPLVSPSLRTAPLASTASPATHASSASTPSSASTTNTTTPASSRPTSSGHPHPHHHAQHTGPAPLKYTHPADALLPPNPNDGITRYTRSTLFSIRDALPTPIPVPAFLTIKDPSPTDPASLGITINNLHIPTGGLSALASPTSPSFASGSARRRGSTFGGFTSAPGSATGSSFHIPNAPSISGGRHSRAPTGATQPQVDPTASTEVLESSMRSLHEALEKLHKDPAATGKTKATEPAPVKQHKLRSAVVETDEKVVPASSSSKLACDLLAADARLSPTHSSSDDVSSETTVKNAPINSPRRPAYELEEGEIPVSPPGGSTVHLHDMASQTLASPPKNLLSPGSSSDGPHSPSLLAAQLLHMVDSDEQVNQGPPTTSVPQQPQAQTASQDFRNHPARAYQHQRGSPMTSSPSNVPAGALTLPPEPPGPPIPVPASANAAATGATSRYRQGSGPTSSTPSISGWRGPTARDTGTSRSRHSTSSAAPSPATSLINSQPWATASSSSTGSPAASPAHNPLAGYESLLPEHLLQQAKESLGDGAPPPARASASNVRSSARTALPGSSAAAAKQASSAAAVELPPALRGKLATLDTVQPSDPVKLEENLEALSKLAPFGGIGAPPARSGAYASTSAAAVMQGQTMGLIAKSHPVPPAVLLGTSPPPPPQGAGATTMPRARNATHPVVDLHGGVRGEPYKSGSTVGPSPPLPPVESQRAGTPPTAGASSSFLERLNARRAATATATARVPSPPSALMTGASADQAPPGPLSTRSLTSGFEGAGNRRESPPSVAQPGSAGPFASTFGSAVAARQSPGAESRGNSLDVQPGSVGAMEQWWMSGNQSERPQQSVQMDQQRHRYMTSPAAPTHSQDSNTTVMSPPTPFAPTHHLPPPSPLYTAAWDHHQQQQQQHQGPPHHSYSHAQQQMQPRLRRTSGAPPMHPHQVQHMFHQQHQHAYGGGGPHDQMYAPYHPHHPHHLPPPPGHPHAHPQHQLAQHAMAMSGSGAGIPGMSPGMPDLMVPDLKRAVESYLRDGQEALLSEYLHFLSYCHPAAAVKPYIKSLLTIGIKLKARERLVAAVYFGMKHGHYSVREVMETLATLDLGVMDLVQGGVAIMMIGFLLACMLKDSVVSPVEMEWLGKQFCAADLVSGQRLAGTLVANLFDIMSQPEFIAVMGLLNLHDLFGEQSAGKIAFQLARYLDVGVVQNVLKSSSAGGSTSAGAGGGNGGGGASPAAAPNAAPSIAA